MAAIVTLFAFQLERFADDPGVGWHLATGKWIVDNGAIPTVDPFLAVPSGSAARAWIADQWLSDLILYKLYVCGGFPLLYLFLAVVYSVTFFGILLFQVHKSVGRSIAAALAVYVAFKLGEVHFILRPVLFAFPLFVIVVAYAFRTYRGQLPARKLFWLPIFFLLWANLHPSFILGLGVLIILWLALLIDEVCGFPSSRKVRLSVLICLMVSILATFINPYGYELHRSIFALGSSTFFQKFHMEWLSPDFHESVAQLFGIVLATFFVGIYIGQRPAHWKSFELLMIAAFAALSFQAVRIFPFFGIVAAIPLAEVLIAFRKAPYWRTSDLGHKVVRVCSWIEVGEQRRSFGLLAAFLWIFACVAIRHDLPFREAKYGPSQGQYPFAALQAIKAELQTNKGILITDPGWGGFITWYGLPQAQAVIDDRNYLLGETFYKTYFMEFKPGGAWRTYAESFNATHLLLTSQSPLGIFLKATGAPVLYEDSIALLFDLKALTAVVSNAQMATGKRDDD